MERLSERRFDHIFTVLVLWFTAGTIADARNHMQGSKLETFLTLEHSIAYTAVMALGLLYGYQLVASHRNGEGLLEGLPEGYGLTLVSIPLFALGGFGDFIWHEFLFGFETTAAQMISPTHLLLGIAASFLVVAPMRRAWFDDVDVTWRDQFTLLTSASLILSVTSFMMLHLHPFVNPFSAEWFQPMGEIAATFDQGMLVGDSFTSRVTALAGLAGIALYTVLFTALVSRLVDHFDVVPGGFTYVFGLNALILTAISDYFVFLSVGVLAGLVADVLYHVLSPRSGNWRYRLFFAAIPFAMFALYFATIQVMGGVLWTVHTWSGVIVLTSGLAVLASYALTPVLDT
jgi:hypothetical protein